MTKHVFHLRTKAVWYLSPYNAYERHLQTLAATIRPYWKFYSAMLSGNQIWLCVKHLNGSKTFQNRLKFNLDVDQMDEQEVSENQPLPIETVEAHCGPSTRPLSRVLIYGPHRCRRIMCMPIDKWKKMVEGKPENTMCGQNHSPLRFQLKRVVSQRPCDCSQSVG